MMPWSKIVISAEDQTGPAFNSARNNVKGFSGDVAASTTQLQSWGQALLGGITVGAVAGKLVAVQREFDVLNSSLITVTGSSAAAEREMAWIKQFAKETPFGLAQATDGFVKMKALGLEPTRASLTSFGNTAAAMGKDLKQMIEAVADASTGEFERLKEFGIKARKEGDSVSLTFQGVTTTVRNSAEEITKYLEGIGNNQFGGAMAERAKTLDGAIAELGDTWDELFRTVNQNATGTLIADTVRMATAAVSDLTEVLGAMTRGADDSARATGALTTIQNGLGTVFETVAVLGLNVKYVLVQIGNELGGLAAQAAAVATLQFSQAAEIGRMMKEDAAAARAQVDAGTARILNARQDANNRGSTLAGSANAGLDKYLAGMTTPPRPTRPASGGGGGGGGGRAARPRAQTERESEEARAYAQAMEAIAKAQMTAAIAGENYTTTQQRLVDIMTSPEWRNMPEEWRLVIAQQGEAAILAEQHAAAQKKANDARKAEAEAATRELESLQSGNAQMREQIDMLGLTTAEQTAYTQALNESAIAKLEDKAASLEMLDADSAIAKQLREQVAALKDRNALLGRKAEKEQLLEAQRAQLDMWKSIDQTAHDVFVNIFEDGAGTFKRLGQTLKAAVLDMLYQMTVKRWIIQIGASFTGQPVDVVSQALGGGQGGIGSLFGGASNGSSLLNLFGGGTGGSMNAITGLLGGNMSWGNALGSIFANSGGAVAYGDGISALLATNGAYGTAPGAAGGLGSIAAGLAVVAAPLIIGALAESRTRDRFSGAAFATSNFGKDPTITIGGAEYDPIKGILPDHDALVGRALEAGISQDMIDRFKDKDRALLHYIRMLDSNRQSGNEGPPINVNALLENDNMYAADWYRGQGYAHPQAMGWWNDKGYDLASNDPAITTASRAVATSIVTPLTEINRILGGAAEDFRVTAGYATRGGGKGVWAGLNISQGENNLVDWVNMDSFHSPQEAVRGMYEQALGALEKLDLPKWAQEQVDGAQAAMAGIKGDKMGEEAAALYAQTAGSIAQTISAIKMLIDVFPDFAGQTQDTVHAIATAMGGLQNLTTAYNSYLEGFYSEEERRALAMKQLGAQFADLGVALPDSRDAFRALVESQDLSTEAGQKMFAALMGLAGAFAAVTPAAESAADAAGRLADEARRLAEEAYSNARSRTDDVWARLQQLFNDQIDNWQKLADEARAIFDIATDAARQLRGEVADTRAWDAVQGRDFIAQALAGLRGTGALPDSDALSRAIESARGGLNMDGYATVAEYERDQLILAAQLQEIGDISGTQASFAEQQVDLLKDQMDQWRKQLDLLRGMDLNITTIAEGITVLADAMRAEQAAQAAIEAAKKPTTGGGGGGASFGGGGTGRAPIDYAAEGAKLKAQDWYGNGDWSKTIGWSLGGVSAATGISTEDLEKYLQSQGLQIANGTIIPKFDVGTNYVPRDMLAQIHEGEAILPKAFNPWANGGARNSNNDDLVVELRAVKAELAEMRRQITYQTDNSDRQLSITQRLTDNGTAMKTQAVTA